MKGFQAVLPAVVLAFLTSLPSPVEASAAPAEPDKVATGKAEAAFQFAIAKELQAEGGLLEASAAFQKAVQLDPDAPYLRAEYAELLARLGELTRAPGSRNDYLQQARVQIDRARELAPDNLDVLKTAGTVYLSLAIQDPSFVPTARDLLEQVRQRDPADVQTLVALGRIYLDQQQPEKAVELFRELVRAVPQQRAAYAFLVEALLQARQDKEAESVLQEILSFDPASLEARLTLAELQGQRGDHKAAADTLRGAPPELRSEPRLRRQLAWSLYLTGDLESSLGEVQPLLGQPGAADDRALNLLTGLIYAAEGRNAEAADLLAKVRQPQSTDVALTLTLSRVLQRQGRRPEAVRLMQELADALVKEGKEEAARQVRLEAAQVHVEGEDWDQAQALLAPLVSMAPGTDAAARTQARALQADVLVGRKQYDEALAVLDTQDLPPSLAGKRGEVLFRAGREAEARQQLASLAAGGQPEAVVAAAQAYHRLERYEDSIPLLRSLVERQKDLVPAHFLLGAAYERSGRREEAAAQFRRVIELDPDYHAALNYLGYMYAERGERLDEAIGLVRRAVALDPDNGSYVDSLGWAHFQLGRHKEAREYLERAVRLDPEDGTIHEHLGDVYVALGQKEKARETYQRALELDDAEVERLRGKLDGLRDTSSPRR